MTGFRFVGARRLAGLAVAGLAASAGFAAVSSTFSSGTLTVTSDADDLIIITSDAGNVLVNGTVIGTAADVVEIVVLGSAENNEITLVTVSAADFPALTTVEIDGGGGDDDIVGSQLNDFIVDPDGGDSLIDGAGDDEYRVYASSRTATTTYDAALGSDTLFILGTNGNDVFEVGPGQTTVGGLTVTYAGAPDRVVASGRGGNDTFLLLDVDGVPVEVDGGNGSDFLALDTGGVAVTQGVKSINGGDIHIKFYNQEAISSCDFSAFAADDCNENGVPDGCEVATGVADDGDDDGLLDDCESDDDDNDNGGNDNGGNDNSGNDNDDNDNSGNDNDDNGNDNDDNGNDNDDNANDNDDDGNDNDDDDNGNDNDDDGNGDDEPQTPADCFAMLCGMGVVPMLPFIVAGMCGLKFGRRLRK